MGFHNFLDILEDNFYTSRIHELYLVDGFGAIFHKMYTTIIPYLLCKSSVSSYMLCLFSLIFSYRFLPVFNSLIYSFFITFLILSCKRDVFNILLLSVYTSSSVSLVIGLVRDYSNGKTPLYFRYVLISLPNYSTV